LYNLKVKNYIINYIKYRKNYILGRRIRNKKITSPIIQFKIQKLYYELYNSKK